MPAASRSVCPSRADEVMRTGTFCHSVSETLTGMLAAHAALVPPAPDLALPRTIGIALYCGSRSLFAAPLVDSVPSAWSTAGTSLVRPA